MEEEGKWPLDLPCPLHALVLANLTTVLYPETEEEVAPETYLCKSATSVIVQALMQGIHKDKDNKDNKEKRGKEKDNNKARSLEDRVPSSLQDACVLVLAVARQPRASHAAWLGALVGDIDRLLPSLSDDNDNNVNNKLSTHLSWFARLIMNPLAFG